MSRRESARIVSILPTCVLSNYIVFATRLPQERFCLVSTPRYVYWSTIGNSSSPHFRLKCTGFTFSLLHKHTARPFTCAVTLRPQCILAPSLLNSCFCNSSGVSDIPAKSSVNINPDTVSSPTATPCLAASTATIRSLTYILNRLGDGAHLCVPRYKLPMVSTSSDIFPSGITAPLTHSVICFLVLYMFPLVPIAHTFFHK